MGGVWRSAPVVRGMAVLCAAIALAGCAATTKVSSSSAPEAKRDLGQMATLSLMGSLDSQPEGEGYQAACTEAFTSFYEQQGLRGVVIAPSLTSLNPDEEVNETLRQSQVDSVLLIRPLEAERFGRPDYTVVHIDASLYSQVDEARVWRAYVKLRPNTNVYWRGDKKKTCTKLIEDVFEQLRSDGFRPNGNVVPAASQEAT